MLSLCLCIHGTEQAQTLEWPSSSIIAIMLPLLVDRVEQNSYVVTQQSPCMSSSTWQVLWGITAVCVTTVLFLRQCCSSCFSFFSASCPSSKSTCVHSSFNIHFEQVLVNAGHFSSSATKNSFSYLHVWNTHQSVQFKNEVSCCHQSNKRVATYQVWLRVLKDFLVLWLFP